LAAPLTLPMELVMYIANDCIDAITIEQSFIVFPGYVGHFVRLLKRKHEGLLCGMNGEPEFLLQDIRVWELQQLIEMNSVYTETENVVLLKQAL
jgi:hypothetical protein